MAGKRTCRRLQTAAAPAKRVKKKARGKPFGRGFDPRRNLKGPIPEVHEIREALTRDGLAYVDQLYRRVMDGSDRALQVAIEQILGKPPTSVELSNKDGKPLQVQVEDARAKLAARFAALAASVAAGEADPKPE